MQRLVSAAAVRCSRLDTDRYGRMVGKCLSLDASIGDLSEELVGQGWALAYRKYSSQYVGAEQLAQATQAGMWSGSFDAPWNYRRSKNTTKTARVWKQHREPASASGECLIKGNISQSGRIYHVPGSRHYNRTRISTRKGERWFCSGADAEAAEWRAPRG